MKTKTSRILAVVLIFQLLAFSACAGWLIYDAKVDRSGWAEKDGVRYYRDFHAKPVTGWLDIDGQRYFFPGGRHSRHRLAGTGRRYPVLWQRRRHADRLADHRRKNLLLWR